MSSNLSKRLDKLERLANELLAQQEGPVYVRDTDNTGDAARAGTASAQAVAR